jgi:hypothetical protein
MTQQNTMPAVLYLGVTHDHKDCLSCEAYYSSSYIDGFEGPTGKYIRADLHTDILKQARKALFCTEMRLANNFIPTPSELDDALTAIDKALGE